MRVLWFTNTFSGYNSSVQGYNSGGWITALEKEIKEMKNVELAVSFFFQGEPFRVSQPNVTYYPISFDRRLSVRIQRYFSMAKQEKAHITAIKKVVADFKPDVIHVFGSERTFGLVAAHTEIPVIIHLQGILTPYLNAYLPPSYSKWDAWRSTGLNPFHILKKYKEYQKWKTSVEREKRILTGCKYFMGRTEWDKRISALYSPASKYFYCSEMLRDSFFESHPWKAKVSRERMQIVTIISSPLYKGADMLLKTAQILKQTSKIDFEWKVYGMTEMQFATTKTGIKPGSVSVYPAGVASSDQLKSALLCCDVFFHPSYIDNSPNSICEAQLLGVPVAACNVGGISSLIEHLRTGILVPANDPFLAASYVAEIFNDKSLASAIGSNARQLAISRHDKATIVNDLMTIYNTIRKP